MYCTLISHTIPCQPFNGVGARIKNVSTSTFFTENISVYRMYNISERKDIQQRHAIKLQHYLTGTNDESIQVSFTKIVHAYL